MEKPAETTTPTEAKHSFNWGGLILWPFLILVLYLLSTGPLVMMMDNGSISQNNEFVGKIYAPLDWVYENKLLHKPFGMYLHLWSKRYDKKGDQQ